MTIYFIEMESEGWIKVGFTAGSAERRMAQLQTGQPRKLRLLGTIPGTLADEKSLHKEFDVYRGNGEWFEPVPELINVIQSLIEHQYPWYFAKAPRIFRDKFERMASAWVKAFNLMPTMDQSSYKEFDLFEKSKDSDNRKKKLFDAARKNGEDLNQGLPGWMKRRFVEINMSPATKYISAWGPMSPPTK